MKNLLLSFCLLFTWQAILCQSESRVNITSFSASINTGQNYNPWLNDNINDLVTSVWQSINLQYVDITLPLETTTRVSRISLYDYQGVFTDAPAYIYAQYGTQKTLLGIFTGDTYLNWVNILPTTPVLANAIVVHKYGNNIPMKIKVFGVTPIAQAVINFPALTDKAVGDAPFVLNATSNNISVPITYTSSNLSIVSVASTAGVWKATTLAVGTANITAMQAAGSNYLAATNIVRAQVVQSPYQPLPGKIEAESYSSMNGIQTENTGDTDGGQNVGYVDEGDWMDYKVDVSSTGTYTLKLRIASTVGSGKIEIRNANGNVLNTVDLPNTGAWQTYTTVTSSINLSAGQQTLRLYAKKAGWNLNWFEMTIPIQSVITFNALADKNVEDPSYNLLATSNNPATPITFTSSNSSVVSVSNATGAWKATAVAAGTADITATQVASSNYLAAVNVVRAQVVHASLYQVLPGKVEAESYSDMSGVLTENTGDEGGGLDVGYVEEGDWMDYMVNVSSSGTYTLKLRTASIYNTGVIEVRNSGGNVLATVNVTNTGNWQAYTTLSTFLSVNGGQQTLRIYAKKGGWNLNWFEVVPVSQTQTVITFAALASKRVGDAPFTLNATSNSTTIPITYTSSNPSIVSVSNLGGIWKATAIAAGSATITATQVAGTGFTSATATQQQTIISANTPTIISGKIPIEGKRWYQLNNTSGTLEKLFDGQTGETPFPGWGLIFSNFDAYYPLHDGESMTIDSIKMFDGQSSNTDAPMTLSIITDTWQRINIATFTGEQYMQWVGPYPNRTDASKFKLDIPVSNARYLVINTNWAYPTELELYGSYTAGTQQLPGNSKAVKLKDVFGVNAFEWDFEAPNNPTVIDESRMNAVKNFTGVRHYIDWEKLELQQGSYTYNPTYSGSWNYDTIYQRCKAEGIEVLACLKTLPGWMQNTYPGNERDAENVPVKYGRDFTNPTSYIEQAKVAFQYAARYGSNLNIDRSLLSVNSQPRWTNDQVNTVKVGMGVIKYIECDNERDKWWKGRKAYQTGREYAANLSAFYDGHKNSMGPGVGIKNADSNMKVVMGGIALANTDYVKGMIDWCKQYRGYKADGKVNLCWDVINYHLYSNDAQSSQSGNSTRGAAPEVSGTDKVAQDFVKTAHEYAYDMPVWVTECGYDINQGSPLKAIAVGNKTVLQTQANWILRTALLYARNGVEKVFFYQLYDENINNATQFASMGLVNADRTRKPAADYLYQTNKLFGQFSYKETISNVPIVDRYEMNGNLMYMMVMPTEKDTSITYSLNLGTDSAIVYTPQIGNNSMNVSRVRLNNGQLTSVVTETPVFVKPITTNAAINREIRQNTEEMNPEMIQSTDDTTTASDVFETTKQLVSNTALVKDSVESRSSNIVLFPNPANNFVNISFANKVSAKVEITVFESGSGRRVKSYTFQKKTAAFLEQIDISSLKGGFYSIEIKQNNFKTVKSLIKVYK